MGPTITKAKNSKRKNGEPSRASSSKTTESDAKIHLAERTKSSQVEIDDIFSGRGEATTLVATRPSTAVGPEKKKKKKKNKHAQATSDKEGDAEEWTGFGNADTTIDERVVFSEPNPPTPKIETVLDPSSLTSTSNFRKRKRDDVASATSNTVKKMGKSVSANVDDAERFRDSRGAGPRRRTEEGFAIFKEDELGIRDAGGDTPLCPFDCDCCF